MDAANFLARVVPPGNYVAVCFKGAGAPHMGARFFPRDELGEAAGFIDWARDTKFDVWFGLASYNLSYLNTKGKLTGHRTQDNVMALRSFWLDVDIKRDGDKKTQGRVHADLASAVSWLKGFCQATSLPLPNMWVNSGYGLHLYWITEDPMTPAVWQPYAEALKQALITNGGIGDLGLTTDSARILRPPGTLNFKVPTSPVPVNVIRQSAEYPNQEIYNALAPYVSLGRSLVVGGHYSSGSLAGAPPSVMGQRQGSLAAAQANLQQTKRPQLFSEIAKKCQQVKVSLANQGAGDGYELWYKGHMTLAAFCQDGDSYSHEISKGDLRYDPANVDTHRTRVADEVTRKGLGAPTCASYDGYRTGICPSCPYYNKLNSPVALGVVEDDLPVGYRRHNNAIERSVKTKDGEDWVKLLDGDVYDPILDRRGNAHMLTFTYELAGRQSYVVFERSTMPTENGRVAQALSGMGVELHGDRITQMMGFIVAWITKLRQACAVRDVALPSFGWARDPKNAYVGFAVGGMLYKADGTQQPAPGGDSSINEMYRPRGDLQSWKNAANFVVAGRPDLQVLVAASFGAPLMQFTGQTGVTLSAWSRDSGVGKSSALKVGQTVWGTYKAMCSMSDTHNAARKIIASTRVMPCYWDEMRIHNDERAQDMLDLFFELAQGKDKARLNSDTSLRTIEEWKTILVTTSNKSFMDEIEREQSTDAGALRLFELSLDTQMSGFSAEAPRIVASLEEHAGMAGAVYAEFIARCQQTVEQVVVRSIEGMAGLCSPLPNERLYMAGMGCILAGAHLAKLNNLVDFDVAGIRDLLLATFKSLRARRSANLTVSNGVTDLDKILGNFIADHASECIITSEFHSRGRPTKTFKEIRLPAGIRRLAFHIGQSEQMIRLDKTVWDTWCRTKRLSPSDTMDQMMQTFGGFRTRAVLGAGTNYASARVDYFSIPLTTPELSEYIYDFGRKLSQHRGTP